MKKLITCVVSALIVLNLNAQTCRISSIDTNFIPINSSFWNTKAWKDTLRGNALYVFLDMNKVPCSGNKWNRLFSISAPLIDSFSQAELDSACRIPNSRWVLNDQYMDNLPHDRLKAGTIERMVLFVDCPPSTRGPMFIIYEKGYKPKRKHRGVSSGYFIRDSDLIKPPKFFSCLDS